MTDVEDDVEQDSRSERGKTGRGNKTPARSIRIPDPEWDALHTAVNWNGDESVSAVVRDLSRGYVKRIQKRQERGEAPTGPRRERS